MRATGASSSLRPGARCSWGWRCGRGAERALGISGACGRTEYRNTEIPDAEDVKDSQRTQKEFKKTFSASSMNPFLRWCQPANLQEGCLLRPLRILRVLCVWLLASAARPLAGMTASMSPRPESGVTPPAASRTAAPARGRWRARHPARRPRARRRAESAAPRPARPGAGAARSDPAGRRRSALPRR